MRLTTVLLLVLISANISVASAQSIEQIESYERRIDEQQRQLDAMRDELETLKQLAGMQSVRVEEHNSREASGDDADTGRDDEPFVVRRSEKGVLSLGGRVHRVVMQVDDGVSTNGFFMDSDQGPTMLRADFTGQPGSDWNLSAALEVGIQSNRSLRVNQDNPNPGTDITVRDAELVLQSDKFGKFSFGRGLAAAWVVPEIDLSGTVPSALLQSGMLAPGMQFVDRSTNDLSSIPVNQHFVDTERLLRVDRLRYDSRMFGGGIQLSGTLAADSRWDTAIRFYPSIDEWTFRAAATYEQKPFRDFEYRSQLGFSARHNKTGLNLTMAASRGETTDGSEGSGYVIKGGWLSNLNSLGHTAFSIDYLSVSDAVLQGDQADSIGFFVQQKWDSIGLDLYAGFRTYKVERPDIDLRPLDVLALGAMYSF